MRDKRKEAKKYFWLSLTITLVTNRLVFFFGDLLTRGRTRFDLSLPFDSAVPLVPWTVSIYFGCFLFWFYMYRRIARLSRPESDRFYLSNLLAKIVCLLFYVLFPTEIVRPELSGSGIWTEIMRFLYRVDTPHNLFPSIHCLIAWSCWVGVRGKKEVSLAWRVSALLMAAAVCLSTLGTRQHVLADVAGGILLSELSYAMAGSEKLLRGYAEALDRLLYGKKKPE